MTFSFFATRGFLAVAGAALLAGGPVSAREASLRVCAADWPPFTVAGEPGGPVAGTLADKVRTLFSAAGYDVVIHVVAWERCLKDLSDGYYAAAYPAAYRQEREDFAHYPKSRLETLAYVAVVRQGDAPGWRAAHGAAALPQPVGVPRGWALAQDLAGAAGLTLDQNSETMEQNLRKLKAGRIGTALLEVRTAAVLLPRIDPEGSLVVLSEPVVSDRPGYLALSLAALGNRGARQLAERLEGSLKSTPGARP